MDGLEGRKDRPGRTNRMDTLSEAIAILAELTSEPIVRYNGHIEHV
jgi:hypothetical protein